MVASYIVLPARPHTSLGQRAAGWLAALLLLALLLAGRAAHAQATGAAPSVGAALNPDGTVRRDRPGSFDAKGYRMTLDPRTGAPVFRTTGAGDESWADNFGLNGANGTVRAVATAANGDVYVGGQFTTVGAVPANNVARWTGSAWQALGNGTTAATTTNNGVGNNVYALAVLGSDLYVGGVFTTAYAVTGSQALNYVARWTGSAWNALGTGLNNIVRALALAGSRLVAGGQFTAVGDGSKVVSRVGFYALPVSTTLTSVSPGAELPGQAVTLTGTGFTAASTVSFGGTAAASVSYQSATSLTAVVPAGATPGGVAVSVSTGGSTASLPATAFEVIQVYRSAAASGCLATAAASVTGASGAGVWRYLRLPAAQGGAVVAAIEDTRNLGSVTVGFQALGTGTSQPVRADGRARYYLDRNFYLTADNKVFTGSSVRVRFYGLSSELSRLTAANPNATAANLKLSQYSGPNEDCELGNNDATGENRLLAAPATGPAGADWFVAEALVADHFSEFYLTGAEQPLPVQLLGFAASAAPDQASVRLTWTTASETGSARFEVERSVDGVTYTTVATVAAAGTSLGTHAYALLDATLPAGAPVLYYRLRQVDLDGSFSYSPVRVVALAGAAAGLSLCPNPATTGAVLTGATPGQPVQVLDALGRCVVTATTDAAGTATLALPAGRAAGVYVVRAGAQALRLVVE